MFFSGAVTGITDVIECRKALRKRLIEKLGPGEVDPYVDMTSHKILPALAEAIHWFKEGKYGICKGCGERIPERRLKLVPTATRCVRCQEEKEENDA